MNEIEKWIVVEKHKGREYETSYNLKSFLYDSLEMAENKVKRAAMLKAEVLERDIIKMHCQSYIAVEYFPGLILIRNKDGVVIESYEYYSKKIIIQLDED